MRKQNHFNYDELITCAKGAMFGDGNPQTTDARRC